MPYGSVVAQLQGDSSCEPSMLARQHEQICEDHQLVQLQSGFEAARFADRLVRSTMQWEAVPSERRGRQQSYRDAAI